jgi:prepilin peptidase dependent protein B
MHTGWIGFGGTVMLRSSTVASQRRQRGLSIVELMVGVAIGLFVVAAATMLVSTQLSDNRRLMLETQVQQDLRASADIIARELRRAGHWAKARDGVWYEGNAAVVRDNPYASVAKADGSAFADGEVSSTVLMSYSRSGDETDETGLVESAEQLGFRLSGGVIQTRLGDAGWQALTDSNTLNVTEFSLTMNLQPIRLECPKPCPDPLIDCRPTLEVRDLRVLIKGEAANDSNVKRSVDSTVRLRNDALIPGTCPA